MLKVSAVIPGYNYAHFLPEAIDSALRQTYPAYEVIVVDDGSTDHTPDVARSYGSKIRSIRTENRGVSAARNTGIAAATGDLIAFLDADDRWLPHKLERQVPLFAADPALGLVHTGSRIFNAETGRTNVEIVPDLSLDFHALLTNCSVSAPSTVVPRAIFDKVGGFDETLSNAADWDMWLRIAVKHRVAGCPEVLVEYREHEASMSRGNELKQFLECLAVLDRGAKVHPGCVHCRKAARTARRRLSVLFYNTSAATARSHARAGRKWQAFSQHFSIFLQCPPLVFVLPTLVRNVIDARREFRRWKASHQAE